MFFFSVRELSELTRRDKGHDGIESGKHSALLQHIGNLQRDAPDSATGRGPLVWEAPLGSCEGCTYDEELITTMTMMTTMMMVAVAMAMVAMRMPSITVRLPMSEPLQADEEERRKRMKRMDRFSKLLVSRAERKLWGATLENGKGLSFFVWPFQNL